MKQRVSLLILLACICFAIAGCGRVWFVDFTEEELAESWLVTGDYYSGELGLSLEGAFISSRMAFGGDFTATVVFDLLTDTINKANFAIWISDGHALMPNNYITNYGRGLGDPLHEEYGVRDYNYLETSERFIVDLDAPYPGLIRNGSNTWKLYKQGDHIKIVMNGTAIVAEFDIEHYQSTYAYLNIFGASEGGSVLLFKSAKVVYYDYMLGP